MYFRSLNEILASLVCILNIVRFEFQIQTRFFYSNQVVWHLFCNLKSYIQVYPTTFIFMNIVWRWNFREFIRFFQKGLNHFKIQEIFKFEFVPKKLTCNPKGIWSWSKRQSCSLCFKLSTSKIWIFFDIRKTFILNFKNYVNLEKSLSGRARLLAAHDDPLPCFPTSARPHACDDAIVASSSSWPTHLVTSVARIWPVPPPRSVELSSPAPRLGHQPNWFGPSQMRPNVNSILCDFLIDLV
jgi:hypothetical protein